jgi:hypothetical protein
VATSGQYGAARAGAHAQAEAVGLGPTTVVRLERALAHEVLRYCTAIRGSVLTSGAGTRWSGAAARRERPTRSFEGENRPSSQNLRHETTSVLMHGQPKTALNTGLHQGTGVSRARSNSSDLSMPLCHRLGRSRLLWCSAARPVGRRAEHDMDFFARERLKSDRVGLSVRASCSLFTAATHLPDRYAQLWTTMWKEGLRCSTVARTSGNRTRATRVETYRWRTKSPLISVTSGTTR